MSIKGYSWYSEADKNIPVPIVYHNIDYRHISQNSPKGRTQELRNMSNLSNQIRVFDSKTKLVFGVH